MNRPQSNTPIWSERDRTWFCYFEISDRDVALIGLDPPTIANCMAHEYIKRRNEAAARRIASRSRAKALRAKTRMVVVT